MKKIVIFGASGYFGKKFHSAFKDRGYEVITDRVDISCYNSVFSHIEKHRPDIVLNCAGKTGTPNVDWCEFHKEETSKINIAGALFIASASSALSVYAVHLGSGCVYTGDNNGKGFKEDDEPNFTGSFYSYTKAVSEKLLTHFAPLQLRIRIPLEADSSSKNVIDKLLAYKKLISIENSITVVEDFIPASIFLMEKRERGIFNMTNIGSITHKEIMDAYTEIVDPAKSFEYMELAELEASVCAPRSNCVLSSEKREKAGAFMPDIKTRVREILQEYKIRNKK
jgi:dTDP-4-dehydrorhamnose reductase